MNITSFFSHEFGSCPGSIQKGDQVSEEDPDCRWGAGIGHGGEDALAAYPSREFWISGEEGQFLPPFPFGAISMSELSALFQSKHRPMARLPSGSSASRNLPGSIESPVEAVPWIAPRTLARSKRCATSRIHSSHL
jgi:hypothetical protein